MTSQVPRRGPIRPPETRIAGDFCLRYLLEIVFRRKRVLLVTLIFVPLLSILVSLLIKPSYLSSTTILLGKDEILNPLVRFDMAVSMTDYNRLGSFQKVIYSRPLIEDAIRNLGLDRGLKTDAEMEAMVNTVRASTHVIALAADSFQIGCSAPNPVLAKNLVETISKLFIEKSLQASRREAMAAVNFIQKELDHYQEELDRTDNVLQEFRKANNETLRTANTLGGLLSECRSKRLDAELELKQEQLYEKLFAERLSGEKPMVISQSLYVQNTPFQRHYQELQLQMGNLLATREKSHPEVLKLQRELDYINLLLKEEKEKKQASETQEVRSPVYQEVQARLEDARIKTKVLEQKVQELQRLQEDLLLKLAKEPELMKEEARRVGGVKLTREIYDNLRLKLEQARVSCEVEIEQQASRFSIIDPPRVPLARYKPIRKTFIVAGVAGGLFLGLTIVFLLEFTDPRLVRPGDLVRSSGLPLVGALPKLYPGPPPALHSLLPSPLRKAWARVDAVLRRPSWRRMLHACNWLLHTLHRTFGARRFELPASMAGGLIVTPARLQQAGLSADPKERALDDFIERVRHIGIAVRASYETPDHLVCLVASAKRGEGKTLMTANLGVVLASDLQKPVLLVDACLESGDLSALFDRAQAPGLGDVLDGRVSLDAALAETGTPHLSILPAGRTNEYADVIFQGAAFRSLLEQLRGRFSLVLIETQDLGTQSDGLLIAPHADGVLLVSRLYGTKKKAIESVLQQLPREKIVGLVTNYVEYWIPDWLCRWV
jgi:polysaccharide chain length determinant protein (PEP-CTERM system associated)